MSINPIYPRLLIPKHNIRGINPKLIYPKTGKSFDLPRFISPEMKEARAMNKIAKHNDYIFYSNRIPPKATPEDIIKLTDDNYTYKRAVWINPKDSKPYYLLENGEEPNGNINLKILNKDGEFVKNTQVKPREIILTDLDKGLKINTEILGYNFNHTDFITILATRFNPFANYQIFHINNDSDISKLKKYIKPETSCISCSYGVYHYKSDIAKTGKEIQNKLLSELKKHEPNEISLLENLKELSKKTRILTSSGNDGKDKVAGLVLKTGFEGVGGLDHKGLVDSNSSSRNSLFTQHYEPYNFNIIKTENGINISGLKGSDIILDCEQNIPLGKYLGSIRGTSYSTPIRAAKIALNEMMNGIL